ncbi:hypothetical protein [Ktedonobacter robiniae]|uniref:Cupin n=1 Tax=Ktedonobacter robiniae TaxID=2778365 RepID=A0ABQ3V293_9CHLR|nr:hypothetical protein [Ktedonobacter robiniae]GHO59010.1 hypothetical protein KSB_74850 [Ktedonobacter robiniae]
MSIQKNPTTGIILDILGPTVEFLTSPDDPKSDFCALKGIMPAGVVVPLHTHIDTEDFIVVSGQLEILRQDENGYEWYVGNPVISCIYQATPLTPCIIPSLNRRLSI